MTNFERIKDMNEEQMAAFLFELGNGNEYCSTHCVYHGEQPCSFQAYVSGKCFEGHIKWLQSEEGLFFMDDMPRKNMQ